MISAISGREKYGIRYKSILAKFPIKGPILKLKTEKHVLMKEKVLQDRPAKLFPEQCLVIKLRKSK